MFNKQLVAQLSGEIQERISLQMENGKMERMQKYATDGRIDSTGLMAFCLAEAKLFCTLYTTDFLMTLAEYEDMDEKMAEGSLEMPKFAKGDELPMQQQPDWELTKIGDYLAEHPELAEQQDD